ncbi:MAG: hypothetical protein ABSF32_03755 [Ignavibacteria bacterium]|jgi:hypothetical protein
MNDEFKPEVSLKIISEELKKLKEKGIIRSKNLVGDVGEYYVSKIMRLRLADTTIESGYDAIDNEGNKVEIKALVEPDPPNKITFKNINFLYCLFLELDKSFQPTIIYKLDKQTVENNFERNRRRLNVSRFRRLGEVVWKRKSFQR